MRLYFVRIINPCRLSDACSVSGLSGSAPSVAGRRLRRDFMILGVSNGHRLGRMSYANLFRPRPGCGVSQANRKPAERDAMPAAGIRGLRINLEHAE